MEYHTNLQSSTKRGIHEKKLEKSFTIESVVLDTPTALPLNKNSSPSKFREPRQFFAPEKSKQ